MLWCTHTPGFVQLVECTFYFKFCIYWHYKNTTMAEKYLLEDLCCVFKVPQRTFDTTVKMETAQIAAGCLLVSITAVGR